MNPIATACQYGLRRMLVVLEARKILQRSARSGNVSVAVSTDSANQYGLARRS